MNWFFALLLVFALATTGCGSKDKSAGEGESDQELTLEDAEDSGDNGELSLEDEDAAGDDEGGVAINGELSAANSEFINELKSIKDTRSTSEATRAASVILSEDPNDLLALNALSMHYFKLGRLGMAKTVLDRAFKVDKQNATLYNSLGVIHLREGKLPEAQRAFREALKINPKHVVAARNLGTIYAEFHDYERALPLLRQAYKAFPQQEAVANNYAVSLRATGKSDLAKKIFDSWDSKLKQPVSLYNYAALALNDLNEPQEALEIIGRIKKQRLPSRLRGRLKILEQQARAGLK